MYPSISFLELNKLVGQVEILDLRDNISYNKGHVPTSKNINYIDLIINPERYINKDKTYYLYCTHGFNSSKACSYLKSKGYNVINLIGGYNSYLNN